MSVPLLDSDCESVMDDVTLPLADIIGLTLCAAQTLADAVGEGDTAADTLTVCEGRGCSRCSCPILTLIRMLQRC